MFIAQGLASQHVEEFERRMRHIDDMMSKVRQAASDGRAAAGTDELLDRIEADRNRLVRDIGDLANWSLAHNAGVASRGAGIGMVLQSIGVELEKMLTSVVDRGSP